MFRKQGLAPLNSAQDPGDDRPRQLRLPRVDRVSSELASASAPSGSMAPAELRTDQDPAGWELTRVSSLRAGCNSCNFRSGTKSQQRAVKAALMKISRVKPTRS